MAKDAIEAVREVEEEAKALLQEATFTSKELRQKSESLAEKEYEQILNEADLKAKQLIDIALLEGEAIAKPMIDKGIEEAKALLDMKEKDLDSAVNIIIERIVNANGNN